MLVDGAWAVPGITDSNGNLIKEKYELPKVNLDFKSIDSLLASLEN